MMVWVLNQLFMVFYDFPLFFRFSLIFMNMQIRCCSSGDELKGTCLTFNLVVYDKYQPKYD